MSTAPRQTAVFAPVLAAALLVVVGGVYATYAGRFGLNFLPGLNFSEPVLATLPPGPEPAARPPLARRVVLVIIDGLALRHSYSLPALDQLRDAGVDASAIAQLPSISRPNYAAIVTGVPPTASGVRNNFYNAQVDLDSLMDRVAARGGRSAFVSDTSSGFPRMFAQDLQDAAYAPWPNGFVRAAKLAIERDHTLVVLLPGSVDIAGHLHGARSREYREAASQVDRDLEKILTGVDLRRDAIIVTADHGHLERGGHGGIERDVREVPLILAGAGVRTGASVRDAQLIDVSPTAAALLGLPPPRHGLGRTLVEALSIDDDTAAAIATADAARIATNREVLVYAETLADAKVSANRARRISLTVTAMALAIILMVLGTRWGAFRIDWRVLLIALPAFPIAFYALLEAAGQNFSLSALPDEGVGTRRVFHFGLASIAVHLLAAWFALRGRVILRDRLAAANAVTVFGFLVASIPAAAAWAIWGAGPFVDLPGPKLLFLIPAMYISVACYTIAAAVNLTVELIIFFARAVDPRLPVRRAERKLRRERARLTGQFTSIPVLPRHSGSDLDPPQSPE